MVSVGYTVVYVGSDANTHYGYVTAVVPDDPYPIKIDRGYYGPGQLRESEIVSYQPPRQLNRFDA